MREKNPLHSFRRCSVRSFVKAASLVAFLVLALQLYSSVHLATAPNELSTPLAVLNHDISVAWSTIPKKKRGYGVVYSAYSFDADKSLPRFIKEASESAEQLKRNNPSIPIAIITNAQEVPDVFDYIIQVSDPFLFKSDSTRSDGIHRQWFTRIYYLAHSPFQITWYVDSHAAFLTKNLERAFREFEASDIDIATANQQPNGFYCHNFAMLYRWNARVKMLFVNWILRQLHRGIGTDDQRPLCHAMACDGQAYGLKYGAISPNWALAWLSLKWGKNNGLWKHRTTRVIQGLPQVCHHADVCRVAANSSSSPRVLYMDSSVGPSSARTLYSQKEINEVLPYPYIWKDWMHPQTDIVVPKKMKCPVKLDSPVVRNPGRRSRQDLNQSRS